MKIHHEVKARVLFPYSTLNTKTDFEGTSEEWEKVKKDIIPNIDM